MRHLIPPLVGIIAFIAVIGPLAWERTADSCAAFDNAIIRSAPGGILAAEQELDIAREVRAWYVQEHLYMPLWFACSWGYWRTTIRGHLRPDA